MEKSPEITENDSKEQDHQRRGVAPEANQLHGKELPPERIGHVLISGEPGRQQKEVSKESIDRQRVATMSRSELLAISDEITIDNTTLRHVYETHLISENGLRRMIYEHMSGGNLREALHNEVLEHETDFERDPQLRSKPPFEEPAGTAAQSGSDSDKPGLELLLSKAGLAKLDPKRELTAPKILPEHIASHPSLRLRQRRLLDMAFIGIILILLILVILLAMSRG